MTKLKIKFPFILNIFVIFFLISFNSYADDSNKKNELIYIGSENASIKIKVYSSFTCPHCADFHENVLPEIKKNYIDNGLVQLIFMDFPLDQAAFNASKLVHCVDHETQIKFMDKIYEKQSEWTNGDNIEQINNNLREVVKNFGINSLDFDKCLNDENNIDKILNYRIDGQKKYSINSTPTIIINEIKLEGGANFKNIKKKIEKLI